MDHAIKAIAGGVTAALSPQCTFDRCVFLLGHMRCGSTALANLLCSRSEFSGYGETHVRYRGRSTLGVLMLNQMKHHAWKHQARYLFDKILHNRYDDAVDGEFYESRGIFLVREAKESIRSIRALFKSLASTEYETDELAAHYYIKRLEGLTTHWHRFPGDRRIAFTYEQMTAETDWVLAALTGFLALDAPLVNEYSVNPAAVRHGAGDPLRARRETRIGTGADRSDAPLMLPAELIARAEQCHADFLALAQSL